MRRADSDASGWRVDGLAGALADHWRYLAQRFPTPGWAKRIRAVDAGRAIQVESVAVFQALFALGDRRADLFGHKGTFDGLVMTVQGDSIRLPADTA